MLYSERLPTAFGGGMSLQGPYRKLKDKLARNSVQGKILNCLKYTSRYQDLGGLQLILVFCEINFKEGREILLTIQQQLSCPQNCTYYTEITKPRYEKH